MMNARALRILNELADLDEEAARVAAERAQKSRALAGALAGDAAEQDPAPVQAFTLPPPAPAQATRPRRSVAARERPRDPRPVSEVGAKRAARALRTKAGIA